MAAPGVKMQYHHALVPHTHRITHNYWMTAIRILSTTSIQSQQIWISDIYPEMATGCVPLHLHFVWQNYNYNQLMRKILRYFQANTIFSSPACANLLHWRHTKYANHFTSLRLSNIKYSLVFGKLWDVHRVMISIADS